MGRVRPVKSTLLRVLLYLDMLVSKYFASYWESHNKETKKGNWYHQSYYNRNIDYELKCQKAIKAEIKNHHVFFLLY